MRRPEHGPAVEDVFPPVPLQDEARPVQLLDPPGAGAGGELESLILQSAYGEYLAQLKGGIAISQVEIVRPGDFGLDGSALETPAVAARGR